MKKVEISFIKGDISHQPEFETVVNAANRWLAPGGGVAGAIHRAAGPQLYEECKKLAPIKPGQAVITSAYNLPNKFVIHCLGPVWGVDKPEDKILSSCYKNALRLAEENRVSSIAFPVISTGAFGYPFKQAVKVALDAIESFLEEAPVKSIKKIGFVLYSENEYKNFKEVFEKWQMKK